ncbi:alpha/beta hydrolase [Georgenia sp. Z1491]|uniref:alpha/beta hydrolase n=1 Tax=Georgenia sp. Z1491 TaxID=3416707 RepID=UPI003CFA3F42
MPRLIRIVPALAAAALVLTACSDAEDAESSGAEAPGETGSESGAEGSDAGEEMPPAPEGLEEFYEQEVSWTDCDDYECADIEVPLDYDAPDGETISLAIKRLPASDGEPIGSMLINPGGPGGSGVEFVEYATSSISPEVTSVYDVVGFDPRGVQNSTQIDCVSDSELDRLLATDYPDTPEGEADWEADAQLIGEGCAAESGDLAGNVDTESAARDMDVIRAVLGESQLDYLGYSYGTLLGSTYADLFPDNVGRMVLDGALDPTSTGFDVTLGQAGGFEGALRAYIEDCQSGSLCPLSGSVDDGAEQIVELLESAEANPLPTGDPDRPLTQALALTGIILPMYDESSWPMLTAALQAAINLDEGSALLQFADLYNTRNPDGTFADNSTEANWAINCLDYPAVEHTQAELDEQVAELEEVAPTFGQFFGGENDELCLNYPHQSEREPGPVSAEGSGPIVVIGTTGDPATPYEWAVGLADQLDEGVLVSYEGEGHTAYGRSNDCVQGAVDEFFLEGTPPEDELSC